MNSSKHELVQSSFTYQQNSRCNGTNMHVIHHFSTIHVAINITLILLSFANVVIHSLGTYLLASLYSNRKSNAQKVYLINLSVLLVFINFLGCVYRIPYLIVPSDNIHSVICPIQMYIQITLSTGICPVYYFNMFYLTLDRLLNVLWNVKYKVHWDETKAMILLEATWISGIITCISISLVYRFTGLYWQSVYYTYFYPTLDVIFITLAFVTYTVLFWKYKLSRNFRVKITKIRKRRENSFDVFRRSRFYIPVLLILSFLLLVLVPHVVGFLYGQVHQKQWDMVNSICWMLYAVSDIINAWVYIFVQRPVRTLLWKKIHSAIKLMKST